MEMRSERQVQKIIDLEIILIIIGVGVDILLASVAAGDWLAAAVIFVGIALAFTLYWHTLHIDRLFADIRAASHHLWHTNAHTSATAPVIPLPSSFHNTPQDVPLAAVADRPIIHVSNFLLSKNFYTHALSPLGYSITLDFPALAMASFGVGAASDVWIKGDGTVQKIRAAFSATSQAMVDDFFDASLNAGGTEAEAPGNRPARGEGYYAAAVYDPDGYTIEAVFHVASETTVTTDAVYETE